MVQSEGYWKQHHWGAIQGITGSCCLIWGVWTYFNPYDPNPVEAGGVAVRPFPFSVLILLCVLCAAVAIPAIANAVFYFRKRNQGAVTKAVEPHSKEHFAAMEKDRMRSEEVEMYQLGCQAAQNFTPIQVQALWIASSLKKLMEDAGPEPKNENPGTMDGILAHAFGARSAWITKMRALYADDYAPSVQRFLSVIRREGQDDHILSRFADEIRDDESIGTIRARLWAIAAFRDGIDFTGNL